MTKRIFKRKIYDKMKEWKSWSAGRYALMIEGARRVGKSTVAEEFARNEYQDYLIIDFSNVDEEVVRLFDHMSDLDRFFLRLQAFTGKSLPRRESVIIFDEVQFCPKARQAIKHLVRDGRYDYIETGSLISIRKNVKDILIPSEEHHLDMYPMDFEEFLEATGKKTKWDFIKSSFETLTPMGDDMNRHMMEEFRLYMLVGGMPQSVVAYLDYNDFAEVDRVKREILRLYDGDFRKLDPLGRASTIFSSIPAELSRNTMRYKVGSVIESARPNRLGELFADITDSRTVNIAYHADDPGVGMALHAHLDYFKMYLADTGLFVTLAFLDRDYTDNVIYRKLLSDRLPTDLGYVYENVVAQLLRSAGNNLYYYTFKDRVSEDTKPRVYEIDFLISQKDKICPIEVKSSGYKSHKSLDEFYKKFSSRIKSRYLLYTKDLRREGDLICLPVYMAGLL
ncbi:MAG: AAA family ATPase [Bacteroidales bacterium]|nr:AAA family ATPase [Bacteroidales bacterium]